MDVRTRHARRYVWLPPTLALLTLLSGCSLPPPQPFPSPAPPSAAKLDAASRTFTTRVMLHGQPLDLHIAEPAIPAPGAPLVLYASGDGGWFGAAVDMFHQLARAGSPVVGFSSRAFLKIQRPHGDGLVDAEQLAADYTTIVTFARTTLRLSDANRVVLTGWSRGAAFSVLAASQPSVRSNVAGIIAIGLVAGEDLTAVSDDDATDDGQPNENGLPNDTSGPAQFDNYATLARLGPVACAVIQSSHDNYLPAADARRLFGPDTDRRRLYAVDAKNHRFSGGKPAFHAALLDALHWISSQPTPPAPAASPVPSPSPASPSTESHS